MLRTGSTFAWALGMGRASWHPRRGINQRGRPMSRRVGGKCVHTLRNAPLNWGGFYCGIFCTSSTGGAVVVVGRHSVCTGNGKPGWVESWIVAVEELLALPPVASVPVGWFSVSLLLSMVLSEYLFVRMSTNTIGPEPSKSGRQLRGTRPVSPTGRHRRSPTRFLPRQRYKH